MGIEKLFRVAVLGGGMLVGGCASKVPGAPADVGDKKDAKVDCETICDHYDGTRESVCPDESIGVQNCCWLMAGSHECCP